MLGKPDSDLFQRLPGGRWRIASSRQESVCCRRPRGCCDFSFLSRSAFVDRRSVSRAGRRALRSVAGRNCADNAGGWRYQLEGVATDGSASPDAQSVLAGLSDDRDAAIISDLGYFEDANAFARLENLLRSNGQWETRPWWLAFLAGTNAEQLAAGLLRGLTHDDVGPLGRITYYPDTDRSCEPPGSEPDGRGPSLQHRSPSCVERQGQGRADDRGTTGRSDRVRKGGGAITRSAHQWRRRLEGSFRVDVAAPVRGQGALRSPPCPHPR